MKNFLCCLCIILFLAINTNAQDLTPKIENLLGEGWVTGISLATVKNGLISDEYYLGLSSVDAGNKVDSHTVFEAASLSKPILAYIFLQCMEEGLIDLDVPLHTYFEYKDLNHDDRYLKITARMVLTHSSGLPNWRRGQLNFQYSPGDRFRYSGEGFVFLQKTLEKITGKDLEALARERVFEPLDMKRSSFIWQESFDVNHAIPHDEFQISRPKRKPDQPNAAYSLQTTASDYARFLVALLNSNGLKDSSVSAMLQAYVPVRKFNPDTAPHEDVSWGLGVGIQNTGSNTEFWHWGDNGPFKAYFSVNAKDKEGFVYFTNSSNGLSIAPDIARLILKTDQPAWTWNGYNHYSDEWTLLEHQIFENGIYRSIVPYLETNKNHQILEKADERSMNNLGYKLLRLNFKETARDVFWMNMQAYPGSANTYDSYAEACMELGRYREAVEFYSKAIEMNPDNVQAKKIISQLNSAQKGNTEFVLDLYPNARKVSLAGEFNEWSKSANICKRRNGKWICKIDLKPGSYNYAFVVDDIWVLDPHNPVSVHLEDRHQSVITVE